MFADPHDFFPDQTVANVTGDGGAQDLDRLPMPGKATKFIYVDVAGGLEHVMSYDHEVTKTGRKRHLVKYTVTKVVADPLQDGVSKEVEASVHYVINEPPYGFNLTELGQLLTTLRQYTAQGSGWATDFISGQG